MSLQSVTDFFRSHGLEKRIITLRNSTATVEEAAKEHGVSPGQIGKTLSFKVREEPILILVAGDKKIDNQKYKSTLGAKAKMLSMEEALLHTGHEVGGICPFGLKNAMMVYLDTSLKAFDEVIPAAGDRNSAIKLTMAELEEFSDYAEWIDVCK